MVQLEVSRKSDEHAATAAPMMLAALMTMIAADASLSDKKRADICSGVRSLCRALNLQPESMPADPRLIAEALSGKTAASVGMSKGRFQNCKSHMDTALAYADTLFRRRRDKTPLAPEYETLLKRIKDKWARGRFRRLFHFATEHEVSPAEINDALFDRFRESLRHSTFKDFKTVDRDTRKNWNWAVTNVPGWPASTVSVPSYVDHYVLPPDMFPQSLWDDLESYLLSRQSKGAADLDILLAEEELFGDDGVDKGPYRAIRKSTANLIRYRVRQLASALVIRGVLTSDKIDALSALVPPEVVVAGLKFLIDRGGGETRKSQIRGIVSDLLMIARLWVKSPASDLSKLNTICSRVRPGHEGLSESARRSLAPFRDVNNVRSFLALPDRIMEEVERWKIVDREAANHVAAALWIKITQRAPLRISNLLSADLSTNLVRSHSGKDAAVALCFASEQVKNDRALAIPLPNATVRLLDLYLLKYRKALIDVPCDALFPAPNGRCKRSNVMSALVQSLMREHLGFSINPHSFRHVAAKLYLSAHPGRYRDVQILLGHKKLETTIKFYCELEAEETFKHFDAVLLNLEQPAAREVR